MKKVYDFLLATILLLGCIGQSSPPRTTEPPLRQTPAPEPLPAPLPAPQPIVSENVDEVELLRTMDIPDYSKGQISQCSIAFSPDGSLLVGACGNGRVPVWEVKSGLMRHLLYESPRQIVACTFSLRTESSSPQSVGTGLFACGECLDDDRLNL